MKGVILAGGKGTRLRPMTDVVNKHVLPVYDEPIIFYPVRTLLGSGIDDIMVVSTPESIGRYIQILENEFDADFRYRVQKEPKGIADALMLADDFVDDTVAVMLGDNIVFDDLSPAVEEFRSDDSAAKVFLKRVNEPSRYGIAEIDDGIVGLTEKPENPESDHAIIGIYLYDRSVFDVIPTLEPSDRGEYEITDVNEVYLRRDELDYEIVESEWFDVGTPEGIFRASEFVRERRRGEHS
ncbi:MAG: sugar phosphate nucleotidyltransferase [Haloarculaceae archaeon]